MNGGRVGFSGSTVRRLTPVRGFYYDVLGFHGYKRYIGASSIYLYNGIVLPSDPPSSPPRARSFISGEPNACSIFTPLSRKVFGFE